MDIRQVKITKGSLDQFSSIHEQIKVEKADIWLIQKPGNELAEVQQCALLISEYDIQQQRLDLDAINNLFGIRKPVFNFTLLVNSGKNIASSLIHSVKAMAAQSKLRSYTFHVYLGDSLNLGINFINRIKNVESIAILSERSHIPGPSTLETAFKTTGIVLLVLL